VPMLPPYYRGEWGKAGFNKDIIDALLLSQSTAELVERIRLSSNADVAKRVGFWFLKAVNQNAEEDGPLQVTVTTVADDYYIELANMVQDAQLNSNAGDAVFEEMNKTGETPMAIAERLNLIQVSDEGAIAAIVDEVLADPASAQAVTDLRAGNDKVIGFLVGQVMKKSQGKANPALAQKLIRDRI
jgi:aspartyl-tRNA(Asn)/glutamyl-tRNA(Gln) amidotransferase subunit B